MAIVEVNGQPWSRYHDELGVPVVPSERVPFWA
jgi:hypothetical protein